jgi:hypothetical protein
MRGQTFSSQLMAPLHRLNQLSAHAVSYDQLITPAGQDQLGYRLPAAIFKIFHNLQRENFSSY